MNQILTDKIYKRAYEIYKGMSWLQPDIFGGFFLQQQIENKFRPKYHAELTAVHKQLWPRRKKIDLFKIPAELRDTIQKRWQQTALNWYAHKQKQFKLLNNYLQKTAEFVSLTADWQVVYSKSLASYRSQTDAIKYTLVDVELVALPLKKAGIPFEIHKTEWGYGLFAPITQWQLDALTRKIQLSQNEIAEATWALGANPRVFNPFLKE